MRLFFPSWLLASSLTCTLSFGFAADLSQPSVVSQKENSQKAPASAPQKFVPFTGKITKNKVRMRLQANYEGPVIQEMHSGELLVVTGETDDFYAVKPPSNIKGFVFRSYVLDNVVEADKVNVRIKPDKEATIIGQLKGGDVVDGSVSSESNKWLEIRLPQTSRFYIAKEYIEKVGDAGFKERFDKKKEAAYSLLHATDEMSLVELQKPFDQMSIVGIKANYEHLIRDYPDIPQVSEKAKEALRAIEQAYSAKKLAYLEAQSQTSAAVSEINKKLNAELQAHKNKISHLERQVELERQTAASFQGTIEVPRVKKPIQLPVNMSIWIPAEDRLFQAWSLQTGGSRTPQEFYQEQIEHSFILKGVVDPYQRNLKNKPGDYMLLNPVSKLPVAFLYSTQVNLQDYVGHEVAIRVAPRDNYNFAFPAYFVLSIE